MITLAEANTMIEAAIAKAEEFGVKISVAVVDGGGRLLAFNRMDGAIWAGAYGCQGKAVAAVAYSLPTSIMEQVASGPLYDGIHAAEGGHIIISIGGVPLLENGAAVAGIGVSGGTGEQDEHCAQAALDAVAR